MYQIKNLKYKIFILFIILTIALISCNSNNTKTPIPATYIYHKDVNNDLILLVQKDYSAEIISMNKTSSDNFSFHFVQRIRFTPDESEMCGICETGDMCMLVECKFSPQYVRYRIKNSPSEFKFDKVDSIVANGVKLVNWTSFVHSLQQTPINSEDIKPPKQKNELINEYKTNVVNAVLPLVSIPDSVAGLGLDQKTKVIVDIELGLDLNVLSVNIIKSSGNSELDRNVKSAIMRFRKFPDLPSGAKYSDYQKLRLTFQFN